MMKTLLFFPSIKDVKKVLPSKGKGDTKYSLMADFVDVSSVEPCDGTIEYFRLSFKRSRLNWALKAARILMDKGYKCFINPVNCNVYSTEEYLDVINKVNELNPYGFSIVDTFGVFRKQDLSRFYYLAEGNLNKNIVIGLHLHENLGLAYSLAQHLIEIRSPQRKINIDCSLYGMGRTPGNLCTEQIMDHLNYEFGAEYKTEPALDAIDDYIAPLKREFKWGYSIPYALSGKYGLHRTYAEYLMGKNRLKTKDIQRILSMIDKNHIELFDEKYIEDLYRQYIGKKYDDSNSIGWLKSEIKDKNVVIVCPGSSIREHRGLVQDCLKDTESISFSVNFTSKEYPTDYAFCANGKRINNFADIDNDKVIITSNIVGEIPSEHIFSFNDSAFLNEIFCEDSTVIFLRILQRCGCTKVSIAGFDGFLRKNPYFDNTYTRECGKNISTDDVKRILSLSLSNMEITFITPSLYE